MRREAMTRAEAHAKALGITRRMLTESAGLLPHLIACALLDANEEGILAEREAQAIRQHEERMAGRG